MQQEITASDESPCFYRQGVYDTVKWRAHIGFGENILRRIVGGLRFTALGFDPRQLRLGITPCLLLLEQVELGVALSQRILRRADFTC